MNSFQLGTCSLNKLDDGEGSTSLRDKALGVFWKSHYSLTSVGFTRNDQISKNTHWAPGVPVAGCRWSFWYTLVFFLVRGWMGGWWFDHTQMVCNCPMVFNGSMFYVFLGLKWLDIFGCMTSTEQLIASPDSSHYQYHCGMPPILQLILQTWSVFDEWPSSSGLLCSVILLFFSTRHVASPVRTSCRWNYFDMFHLTEENPSWISQEWKILLSHDHLLIKSHLISAFLWWWTVNMVALVNLLFHSYTFWLIYTILSPCYHVLFEIISNLTKLYHKPWSL